VTALPPPLAPEGADAERRRWILAAAVFVAALVMHLPYLAPGGPCARNGEPWPLIHDEGTVLYDSSRIAAGETMYRDFFEFQGPAFYYAVGALFAATGPSPLAARLLVWLVWALSAALLALLVARRAGALAGVGAAAVHVFLFVPFYAAAYPHWIAELLVLAALVVATAPARGPRHDWVAGALAGAAAVTIQSVGLPVLVALVGTAAWAGVAARAPRKALAASGRVAGGAAAILGAVALLFAVRGALGALVYDVFVWPFVYYGKGQPNRDFGPNATWVKTHLEMGGLAGWAGLAGLYVTMALPWITVAAGAAVAARALFALRKAAAPGVAAGEAAPLVAAGAAVAAVSPVLAGLTRQDLTHAAFVLGTGLAGIAALATPRARWSRAAVTAALAAAGVVAAISFGAKFSRTYDASRRLPGWRAMAMELEPAKWLETATPPGARVVDGFDHAGWVYLYARPSAVAHTLIPRTKLEYFSDAQWQRIADEIVARLPAALALEPAQWRIFTTRRPEIATLYRAAGPKRYLLAPAPSPAVP
jgi:hypothetical protein